MINGGDKPLMKLWLHRAGRSGGAARHRETKLTLIIYRGLAAEPAVWLHPGKEAAVFTRWHSSDTFTHHYPPLMSPRGAGGLWEHRSAMCDLWVETASELGSASLGINSEELLSVWQKWGFESRHGLGGAGGKGVEGSESAWWVFGHHVKITQWFGLGGRLKIVLFQPSAWEFQPCSESRDIFY